MSRNEHHRVVVIRVEVRGESDEALLIQALEVGDASGGDRLLGTATTVAGLCGLIEQWLDELMAR